jgi:hypothetical protein
MVELPKEDRATLFAENVQVIPEGPLTVRVTVLLKPLSPVRVIVEFAGDPALSVRLVGLAKIVKSTTWNVTATTCVRGPLVPETETVSFPMAL